MDYVQSRIGDQGTVIPTLQAAAQLQGGQPNQEQHLGGTDQNGKDAAAGTIEQGRWFTRGEVVGNSRVAVIGSEVRDEFYPGQNPIGRKLDVSGQPFTIIGLLAAKGGSLGGSQDNVVNIPVTTAQQVLNTRDISGMLVEVHGHRPDRGGEGAGAADTDAAVRRPVLGVHAGADARASSRRCSGTLTAMLAGLASISLLVGGIGIMNIMLVSVSERTREIGIRKAVGARTYDILSQFVIEAMVLSVLGGVLGILVGAGGALAMQRWVPAQVTFWAVALAFLFSAAVGVFFGVYPAYRASRLDPIEALQVRVGRRSALVQPGLAFGTTLAQGDLQTRRLGGTQTVDFARITAHRTEDAGREPRSQRAHDARRDRGRGGRHLAGVDRDRRQDDGHRAARGAGLEPDLRHSRRASSRSRGAGRLEPVRGSQAAHQRGRRDA